MNAIVMGIPVAPSNLPANANYLINNSSEATLTLSQDKQVIEFDGQSDDETNTGLMASYTMGSISIAGGFNKLENVGGSGTAKEVEASIFNIAFSF